MAEFGPWTRLDYEAAPPQDFEGATEAAQPSSKRTTSKGAASRTPTTPTPRVASTVANAGSTNGFGSTAPFGSATSRFSPSMSMAHHVPGHKPHIAGATTARGSKPNTRWVPQALRVEEPSPEPPPPPPPPPPPSSSSARLRAAAATGVGAVVGACSFGRPRCAAEEQRISRKLRAEISAMRDAKLAELRGEGGGSPDEPAGPCRRPGGPASQRSPRTVVALNGRVLTTAPSGDACMHARTVVALNGRVLQRYVPVGEHACAQHGALSPRVLERFVPVGEHVPQVRSYIPFSDAEGAREISMEYASLLAFVAGESRTR